MKYKTMKEDSKNERGAKRKADRRKKTDAIRSRLNKRASERKAKKNGGAK